MMKIINVLLKENILLNLSFYFCDKLKKKKMKNSIILLVTILSLISYSYAQENHKGHNHAQPESMKVDEKDLVDATMDFKSKVVDYGLIDHNSDGNREFVFTNNGKEPLIIKNAKASCGCTVPDYPKGEIKPGETGEIKVKYATNRVGKFTKTITLTTNASKKPIILTIKGEVNPPPKEIVAPEKDQGGAPLEKN